MKQFDLSLLYILLLALGGGMLVLYASPWGIGLSPDSIHYIQAARNLFAGSGLTLWGEQGYQPLTHFPPLYPLLLAAAGSSRLEVLSWAHEIQGILFAATIATVGLIVRMCSPRARWLGALAAGVACCTLPFLEIHAWAWSEPLFVLLSMWGLLLLYQHLEQPNLLFLACSAGLVALACLARYTGFALALAGVISILLLSRKILIHRITDSLVFTVLSLLPVGAWLAHNSLDSVNSTKRALGYHLLSLAQVKTAVVVFTTWLAPMPLPNDTRLRLALAVCGTILLGAFLLWKRKMTQPVLRPVAFLVIFMLSYMLALGVSLSFFDSSTPINNRLLSPVFAASVILAGCLAGIAFRPFSTRQKLVIGVCFLWIICVHLQQASIPLGEWRRQGLGYASAAWAQSDVMQGLRSMALFRPIYSNEPEAIYLYTGQHALSLPDIYNPLTLLENDAFNAEMQHMGEKMRDNNGILVIFRTSSWRPYQPTEAEILERLPLFPSLLGGDGTIYTWKDGS